MTDAGNVTVRVANPSDAGAIAALHADSWRRNYRGAYSDAFLDGDVDSDRLAVWSSRLRTAGSPPTATFVAESPEGALAGFVHVAIGADPEWGSLLDNLHVSHQLKRSGIGTVLIIEAARVAVEHHEKLHLYVLEQNTHAQAFYQARGGRFVESSFVSPPGGVASRLSGSPKRHLYAWDDPSTVRTTAARGC